MDWSELNHDLLRLIAIKVKDIFDFVRLRAVCKRWRSIVDLSNMASQSPCRINYKCKSNTSFDIQFHQIFSKRIHTVPINNISMEGEITRMRGSLSGILLFHKGIDLEPWLLLNPLTGFQALLPFDKDCYPLSIHPIYFGPSCLPKTNLSKNDIDVAFIFEDNRGLRLCGYLKIDVWRYHDMEWTRIAEVPFSVEEYMTYCTNGKVCFITVETIHTRIIDINTGKETVISCHVPAMNRMFLVEEGGDQLCVFNNIAEANEFEVHLLEDFDTNPRLRKLKSIGNRVIFINGYSALCLKASDCEGYRTNCIYFCTNYWYDIESNTTELTCSSINSYNQWFIPSLF